jgi:4'-phosphopantetheinyl transferase
MTEKAYRMTQNSGFGIGEFGEEPISDFESRVLYLIQTQSQIPENDDWLSREEKNISLGFRVPKRRNDWRLGRWTAKQAILACHNKAYPEISSLEIRAAQDGAPEPYYEGAPAPVSISLSHSKDRALCAVALGGAAVGCDLEWIEPRERNFAEDYFTQEEMSFVLKVPETRELAETLIWSAKEATLKILRQGLTRDTRSIRIRVDCAESGNPWNSWTGECLESTRIFPGWWCAAEGFVYTIASDRRSLPPGPLLSS